jgi:hypothetical protein
VLTVVDDMMPYRKDLILNLFNIFHIFGGTIRAKIPLPSYLPDAKMARIKLIAELKQHPLGK